MIKHNILQHITKYYNILHTIDVKQKFPTFLFFLFQLHLSSKLHDCTLTPEQLEVFMIQSSEWGCLSYDHRFGRMNSSIIFYSDFALKSQFLLLVTASHFNLCFFFFIPLSVNSRNISLNPRYLKKFLRQSNQLFWFEII